MIGHGGALHVDSVVSPEPPGRCGEVESGSKHKSEGVSAMQRQFPPLLISAFPVCMGSDSRI